MESSRPHANSQETPSQKFISSSMNVDFSLSHMGVDEYNWHVFTEQYLRNDLQASSRTLKLINLKKIPLLIYRDFFNKIAPLANKDFDQIHHQLFLLNKILTTICYDYDDVTSLSESTEAKAVIQYLNSRQEQLNHPFLHISVMTQTFVEMFLEFIRQYEQREAETLQSRMKMLIFSGLFKSHRIDHYFAFLHKVDVTLNKVLEEICKAEAKKRIRFYLDFIYECHQLIVEGKSLPLTKIVMSRIEKHYHNMYDFLRRSFLKLSLSGNVIIAHIAEVKKAEPIKKPDGLTARVPEASTFEYKSPGKAEMNAVEMKELQQPRRHGSSQ